MALVFAQARQACQHLQDFPARPLGCRWLVEVALGDGGHLLAHQGQRAEQRALQYHGQPRQHGEDNAGKAGGQPDGKARFATHLCQMFL
ncbi:hypothetical protein D9M68_896380 [compost metagenome]